MRNSRILALYRPRPESNLDDSPPAVTAPLPEPTTRETPAPFSLPQEVLAITKMVLQALFRAIWFCIRAVAHYLRYHPIHAVLNLLFVLGLGLLIVTGSEVHKQLILSRISDQTIDRIIESSVFTRDFDATAANRDGAREFFQVGAPTWIQRESIRAILFHSRRAGLSIEDQAALLATAEIESGFNPLARAPTTTACGLFQFVARTGQAFNLSPAECMDPWMNARAGIDHYITNFKKRVEARVGEKQGAERAFKTFELTYYLHHDGPNSMNHSNDVKGVVINGSDFLFRAYEVLVDEAVSHEREPTFTEIFRANLWNLVSSLSSSFVTSAAASDTEADGTPQTTNATVE